MASGASTVVEHPNHNPKIEQGTLTEGEGSVQLIFSLRLLCLKKLMFALSKAAGLN